MAKKVKLISNDEVWAKHIKDPEFASLWQKTALARAVDIAVCKYRSDNDLTQQQLADQLGWPQSSVARLESGDHNPTLETLAHLSSTLGLQFNISVTPTGVNSDLTTKRASDKAYETDMADGQAVVAITIID